ncbi:MAG TPA: ABC transporter ATP-binding protein [Candidatus Dormibacteraeota bacterium]|nr:ABC transporter ATP-binding protein [Candidatus Dormibacteraeota bacterium]
MDEQGVFDEDKRPAPAVSVTGLRKTYAGGVQALTGIDFEVAPGEVFGLLGPNGAGKSTTIGILTTLVAPTAGVALVCGFDVATQSLEARALSSVVFQEQVLDLSLTGRRQLEIHARLWGGGRSNRRRIDEAAELLGIGTLLDRTAGTYSGGQRRRLEIARALVSQPRVLFLDEPTVGLDPRVRHELIDAIAGLRAQGTTIMLTTHYLDEAERLCDRVAIMHAGAVVALDTPRALLDEVGDNVVELRVRDAPQVLEALRSHGLAGEDAFTVGSTVTLPLRGRTVSTAMATIATLELGDAAVSSRPPSLDDVYLRLTGGRIAAAA